MEHTLKQGGFDFSFKRVDTEGAYIRELERFRPSVILSDHGLPAFDGFSALSIAQRDAPDAPFIFVTGSLGEEMTIQALKSGATDFILKHRLNALPPAIHRALAGRVPDMPGSPRRGSGPIVTASGHGQPDRQRGEIQVHPQEGPDRNRQETR